MCTADFFNGCEQQETEPALLLIQGIYKNCIFNMWRMRMSDNYSTKWMCLLVTL